MAASRPAQATLDSAAELAELERAQDALARAGVPVPHELLAKIASLRARVQTAEGTALAQPAPAMPARALEPCALAPPPPSVHVHVGQQSGGTSIGVVHGPVVVSADDAAAAREREAMRAYRRFVLTGCERLSTRLIEREQNDPAHAADAPALAQVYVALDTTSTEDQDTPAAEAPAQRGLVEDGTLRISGIMASLRMSVLQVLRRERRVALVAHAGYGKSTVLGHTALCLAMDGLEPDGRWHERISALGLRGDELVPVPVVLRELAAELPDRLPPPSASTIPSFVEGRLREERREAAIAPLNDALERGRALVLLDGLDEVPVSEGRDLRAHVRMAIQKLADRYPTCRIVVSCRVLTYDEDGPLKGFFRAELAPLDRKKIRAFVGGFYAELARVRPDLSPAEAARLTARLDEAIGASSDLLEMARSPLLLTVMAVLHATLGELPDAEAELYREAVDILLWRWGQVRGQSPKDLLDSVKKQKIDLLVALRQLAFDIQSRTQPGAGGAPDIPVSDIVSAFKKLDPRRSEAWAEEMLAAVQHRAGLLLPAGHGNYRFPHMTYQELLAGWHLVHQPDFPGRAARLLRQDSTRWRKVVLLGVGLLVRDGNLASIPALIAELCPLRQADATDETWRQAWRAGEIVQAVKPERLADTELGREVVDRVRDRLCALVRGGELAVRERLEAARVLGRIGDPRFREDTWGLPAEETLGFVRIPAGSFRMGSDRAVDQDARDNELPAHPITLPEVWMARYPVTVGQWRAFVRATGPAPMDEDRLKGTDNEPVRWVSWEEAVRFAGWLDGALRAWPACPAALRALFEAGYRVTLPSEAEWEKTARDEEGRLWPWGSVFEDDRLDTGPFASREVHPVGCLPSGATPEGVHDLAGNVWEWTRSKYASYPYSASDGRESPIQDEEDTPRALRGGSFFDLRKGVRSAYRIRRAPGMRLVDIGFRLVLSPS